MKLPQGHRAHIPPSKLRDYLLCPTHPVGRWKARFLRGLGFDEMTAGLLERELLDIAVSEDVKDVVSSAYGTKYVIEGLLETPTGGRVRMETVWIIERGEDRPRFVTAYPVDTAKEEP